MKAHLARDLSGYPVLLSVPAKAQERPDPVALDATSLEVARRRDAVRDAAREFEPLSEQDLRERLRGVTSRDLTQSEVAQFSSDVRQQVLDDLVDTLDQSRFGKLRARRRVRVVAPRGYVRMTVRGLSEEERLEVDDRLKARGWGEMDVRDVLGPVPWGAIGTSQRRDL